MKSNRFVRFGSCEFRRFGSHHWSTQSANEFSVDEVAEVEDVLSQRCLLAALRSKMEKLYINFVVRNVSASGENSTKRILNYCLQRHSSPVHATLQIRPKNTNSILAWKFSKVYLIVSMRPKAMNIFVHEII